MKADTTKQPLLCENQLSSGSSLPPSYQALVYTWLAPKNRLHRLFAHASQEMLATLRVSLAEIIGNKRLIVALLIMLVVAPCAGDHRSEIEIKERILDFIETNSLPEADYEGEYLGDGVFADNH